MRCLEGCDFLIFSNKTFNCEYYGKELELKIDGEDLSRFLEPQRCKECMDECYIGSNTLNENVKKVKYRIGLLADSFYSFKDDLEGEMAEIYRLLKKLEEDTDHAKE